MLELTDIDAFYGNSRALQGINLMVGNGEFLSVLGRNGVGKTTLMRSILGLMDRVTGRLSLDGADISPLRTYQRAKAGIAYVTEDRKVEGFFETASIARNIYLGLLSKFPRGRMLLSRRETNSVGKSGSSGSRCARSAMRPRWSSCQAATSRRW